MNELVLVDKIEKRLQERREPVVFPLAHNHRKELRKLRDENIGNLRSRLNTIKQLKREEYLKKYNEEIAKEFEGYETKCSDLNKDWEKRIKSINKTIKERQILEKKSNIPSIMINADYGDIANVKIIKEAKRTFIFDSDKAILSIANKRFDERFAKPFEVVGNRIDDIRTKYEEAINFGDLEIVKELYYIMKKADGFFEKVEKLVL